MKTIIAGCRDYNDYSYFCDQMQTYKSSITEIVSGGCSGVDQMAIRYAKDNGIPYKIFMAEWSKYGKGAGPIRNRQMNEYIGQDQGQLIAFWDQLSSGTKSMINIFNNSASSHSSNNCHIINILK